MRRRWLIIFMGILALLLGYEIFNNSFSFTLILLGAFCLLLQNHVPKSRQNLFMIVGVTSLMVAIFTSRLVLAFAIVGILILIGNNPQIFQTIREIFSQKKITEKSNDFIMVDFETDEIKPAKITRNRWIGEDTKSEDSIYSWEDINFTKLVGNTIFDLGNTILPKEQNIILIRQGIGNVKVLVPEGVAVSLDVSMLFGKVFINQDEIALSNETLKWYSNNYHTNNRKIKIVSNVLLGEVEVIFL